MRNWDNCIDGENGEAVTNILHGRRIVAVDEGEETLTLDDGTILQVWPNGGCGGCPSGHYWLNDLAECDNIITRAEVRTRDEPAGDYHADEVISIYVYAEGIAPKAVIEVQGSEGNGYYGRGFEIEVKHGAHS